MLFLAATTMPTSGSVPGTVPVAISLLALVISLAGFTLSLLTFRWNRHEKTREAVTNITRAMCKTLYHLSRCNEARRRRDLLIFHHSPIVANSDAAHHVDNLFADYNTNLSKSAESHGAMEAELGAQRHRFNLDLSKLLGELQLTLSRIGDAVNRGDHNVFDLLNIRFKKLINCLSNITKGKKLSLEAIKEISERSHKEKQDSWISDSEMHTVSELVHKRATDQAKNTFLVFGPEIILKDASILKATGLAEKLRDQPFAVSFQDGVTVKQVSHSLFFLYTRSFSCANKSRRCLPNSIKRTLKSRRTSKSKCQSTLKN